MIEISKNEYEELQAIKLEYENLKQNETDNLSNNKNQDLKLDIEKLTGIINTLKSTLRSFTKSIETLATANEEITDLVIANDRISFQTNLLSINAKIEASRAGEEGKGFAIVADEVKKLAASSKDSTQEIGNKISEISNMTQNIKDQSFKSIELIEESLNIAAEAADKLN